MKSEIISRWSSYVCLARSLSERGAQLRAYSWPYKARRRFEQWSHRAHFPICRVTVFNGIVKNACKRLGNNSCHVLHQLCWDHLVTIQATYAHWSLSVSFQREIYLCDEFTEASEFVCAPVFKDCFDTLMISKILTIILFISQRYIISDGNKVFIEQFGNFLFVSNNPVFFF